MFGGADDAYNIVACVHGGGGDVFADRISMASSSSAIARADFHCR